MTIHTVLFTPSMDFKQKDYSTESRHPIHMV